MPRSSGKVFKKRKGKFYPKKNVPVPNTGEKKCARENKLSNLDESYAEFQEDHDTYDWIAAARTYGPSEKLNEFESLREEGIRLTAQFEYNQRIELF
ncbi:hypothetical protein JTE90_021147 [Oedothorax gibbosus]|uniref:Uncharacterized protein n=1 Tax=Oedothorax gibbosus TaxID=931172 RepID=A0AAV6U1F9_9ARAC|nr:hypothetical protein JTE90_021147 [Oedothorax gibbosus]